ncbi:MAG: hypothetical protein WCG47_31775, partial [Dermatophilaceae bacterium]
MKTTPHRYARPAHSDGSVGVVVVVVVVVVVAVLVLDGLDGSIGTVTASGCVSAAGPAVNCLALLSGSAWP